jgi:hypothetical protein
MNVVFLSPNFPPQFYLFCTALAERGVKVLGIGDSPPEELRPELRGALAQYVYLPRLEDYDEVHRQVAFLISRHGRVDRIDSHNEHWLGIEARLREDFNIPGQRPAQAAFHRSKFGMAEVYRAAQIPHPALERVSGAAELRAFATRVGLPLVLKPEVGVGAGETFKISTAAELEAACARGLSQYVAQRFVEGTICSYDGLVDRAGRIVFSTSHVYSAGVMEVVNEQLDMYYFSRRVIPPALEELGRRTVAAFDVRERFFHCEFFELADGSFVALEINLRPPGGFTLDMMNYACDVDLYKLWARILAGDALADCTFTRPFHCAHIARRRQHRYALSHEQVLATLGTSLMVYRELPLPISVAMGDQVYIARHPDQAALLALIAQVQQRA